MRYDTIPLEIMRALSRIIVKGIERVIRPTNHKIRLKERFGERRFCDSHPESLLVTSKRHVLGRELMHMISSPSQNMHNSCCEISGSRFSRFGASLACRRLKYPSPGDKLSIPSLIMLLMLLFSSRLVLAFDLIGGWSSPLILLEGDFLRFHWPGNLSPGASTVHASNS